ncbi:MAG: glycerate kinase [Gemmatimonadetes bacterium]|nr:glycerate kinase [Gemmatimonadota bacterium]
MHVLAVAQALKETLDGTTVAAALESGIVAAGAEPVVMLGSDGGDGLLEALRPLLQRHTRHTATGPLGERVAIEVGWLNAETAVVESRMVCGLALVPSSKRDPRRTSTRGVGEVISQVEALGAAEVYVGLGGSATMDGGVGMARAWGWGPLSADGAVLGEGGESLAQLRSFQHGERPRARVTGLADVRNDLVGPRGARVYAAQKGATAEAVEGLARGLERLAQVAAGEGQGDLARQPGSGAAGGLGFGILFFAGGSLVPGAAWVLDRLGFNVALRRSDLVICCEGAFDATSLEGKLTGTVLDAARDAGVPAGLVAPRATGVPESVLVETGGGRWSAGELSHRTALLVERALRTRRDA